MLPGVVPEPPGANQLSVALETWASSEEEKPSAGLVKATLNDEAAEPVTVDELASR